MLTPIVSKDLTPLVRGDTHARGLRHYRRLMTVIDTKQSTLLPTVIKALREAALADDKGKKLDECLRQYDLAAA